ncbi:hypothetical protein [Sphingomonas sp. GC_Shp_3]|uniref:hypothetical protein n=1 Tax=Sphingomonas sp. GC_Shp_3 TaxID=2937383 RepID=UPI00226A89FF|nr:hypothetical protein [Sphingomonas sp. GC_Shp_3]
MAEAPHARDALLVHIAGEYWPEPVPSLPHCLVAHIDAAFDKQVLGVPQRQWKTYVYHHHEADHLGRRVKAMERRAVWLGICGSYVLGITPVATCHIGLKCRQSHAASILKNNEVLSIR